MNSLKAKYGNWALITGASSGIGKEFAIQLAQQNINLVLVARRDDKLKELASELEQKNGIETIVLPLDLSKPNFIKDIEQVTYNIEIGLVINNAGFTITKEFIDSEIQYQQELINVNITALIVLTHYFGNKMKQNRKGGIINVASGSGYLPIPNWATYAASKAYVLHFTEALWYELKPFNVDVLALCPGVTKTEFNNSSNMQKGMTVAEVVSTALHNLSKRPSVIVGIKNKFSIGMLKLFGRKTLIKIGAKIVQ